MPPQEQPKEVTLPSGLRYVDLEPGDGTPAKAGDVVAVHYTGWLADKTEFDSSRKRNVPFRFRLGEGMVIKGWDEGVAGMKPGGKRRLLIPSALGYGKRGAGDVIPPDADLVFEVELLGIGGAAGQR
ncbi:MAG TPA: FKBP-type peptidyl-prolyl cis-trans isomerase [Thermoanaerobaculia bacterium]|nr:FKBP-type peptidyl-prolyl cis-trans isomerase [Thermoanaerobaculia bacterium]